MAKKDKKRKEALETKRLRDIRTALQLRLDRDRKIEMTRKNIDHKLEAQK